MKFTETALRGAYIVEPEPAPDERGFFARTWCQEEFAAQGLSSDLAQCNISFNRERGVLRGLHYQQAPHAEAKLVRCTRGAIFDVIVDLRPDSATYTRWTAVELQADNYRMLYIPEGFAHGFQTLLPATEVFYQMSEPYHAESARGVRWDDPVFAITWPPGPRIISAKDRQYPDFAQ
jgi:dTDP-4-dehydrorhamnose 3,5-epimerase